MPLLVVLELFVMTHQGPTHAAVHLANMVTLTHNAVSTYMYMNMYTKLQKLYYTRLLPIQPLPFSFLKSQSYVLGLQAVELWLPLSNSSLEKKEGSILNHAPLTHTCLVSCLQRGTAKKKDGSQSTGAKHPWYSVTHTNTESDYPFMGIQSLSKNSHLRWYCTDACTPCFCREGNKL